MLKDITFGQYVFGKSFLHRIDPRIKIIFTVLLITLLFIAVNAVGLTSVTVLTFVLYGVAKIPLKMIVKSLKPILPIVVFTSILNMFFISGEPLVSFWVITITKEGLFYAVILSVRIVALISISSLLTYTTSPIELTDAIERLLSPFKVFKLPVHELALMMTIALRFIPTLIEETDKIMSAQKSRGANIDTGSLQSRIKSLIPILIPLFVSSFRRADELALAMECRCYKGGEGRTRLKQLRFKGVDIIAVVVFILFFSAIVSTNLYFEAVI